jgi:hypothetical protein
MTFKNSNENVMYEAVTDTNYSSYLVTLDQVYDIVHGESNCLVNLDSGRTITLSWELGSKEEGTQRKEEYYLMKVCKLAIMFLLKIMVINGHGNQFCFDLMGNNTKYSLR